jgi:lysophospholipase L1-like esterase
MTTSRFTASLVVAVLSFSLSTTAPARAQAPVTFIGMGDSIGEGVQSADASVATQPFSFLNLIAWRMGADFPLPLIRTNPLAQIGSVAGRSRLDPTVETLNLAASGATAFSILNDAATATTVADISTETELVLFPRVGSQIDVAEQLHPRYVACWIGSNDTLGAILAFNHLDASQMTPVSAFRASFTQLVTRLDAAGTRAVFGTIPDISSLGYMLNRQDLIRFLGRDYGLRAGSLTTLPAMVLVKLGLLNGAVFQDPDYVLDPAEQRAISARINELNAVIVETVTAHHMALADMHGVFQLLSQNTLNLFGIRLTTRFLGGLFSLDGVHPSNVGHALTASVFIDALNRRYGAHIPQIDAATLFLLTATDPFIDKDRDGRVTGRFGQGLLETLFALLGFSGDVNDGGISLALSTAGATTTTSQQQAEALEEYVRVTGHDLRTMSPDERVEAIHRLFETRRVAH